MQNQKQLKQACDDTAKRCEIMMRSLQEHGFSPEQAAQLLAAMLSSPSIFVPFEGAVAPGVTKH